MTEQPSTKDEAALLRKQAEDAAGLEVCGSHEAPPVEAYAKAEMRLLRATVSPDASLLRELVEALQANQLTVIEAIKLIEGPPGTKITRKQSDGIIKLDALQTRMGAALSRARKGLGT